MLINRTKSWLLGCVLPLFFCSLVQGQIVERRFSQATGQPIAPVLPESDYLPQVDDFQIFDQADLSTYGSGVQPNEGIFFKYEFLDWTISAPGKSVVGDSRAAPFIQNVPIPPTLPTTVTKFSSGDNTFIDPIWQCGNRVEAGWVEDRRGWLLSAFKIQNYSSNIIHTDLDIAFVNTSVPFAGLTGLTLPNTRLSDKQGLWGAEVMRLYRMPVGPYGGQFEFMAGPRYFRFNDNFTGFSKTTPMTDNFAWQTITQNQLIGAQVGFRFSKRLGRLTFVSENRFMGAANIQLLQIEGRHGDLDLANSNQNPPFFLPANSFNSKASTVQFSPLGELRMDVNYQVFRSVSLTAGWTGIFVGGIARSSERTVYTLPNMGVTPGLPRGDVFINGISVGVVVNR